MYNANFNYGNSKGNHRGTVKIAVEKSKTTITLVPAPGGSPSSSACYSQRENTILEYYSPSPSPMALQGIGPESEGLTGIGFTSFASALADRPRHYYSYTYRVIVEAPLLVRWTFCFCCDMHLQMPRIRGRGCVCVGGVYVSVAGEIYMPFHV